MPTLAPVVVSAPEPEFPELTHILPDARRPQSMVDRETIEQVASPFADFGSLANLTPSFLSSAPNGVGFDAAKNMTLRGFPDGQFNVTLDGIPFADPDGFSHHSTSFFPASSIDHIIVDRSPGSGTTLGYATIGGSIDMASLEIPANPGVHAYGSYGSFDTSLAGARLSNGKPTADGQTGLVVNAQRLDSNGAMSYGQGTRDDVLFKSESRLSGGAQVTVLYAYDRYHFNNPPSVSTQQIDEFGRDFGFNAIAGTPTYYGYSDTDRHADFGYARLRMNLSGSFTLSETAYSYSYSTEGLSLKGDSTASPVGSGFGVPATDIGGRFSENDYRVTGNVAQLEHADEIGVFKGGLWLEHSYQKNTRNAVDLTTGASYNINKNANSPYLYQYWATLDTVQPYAEYKWQATPDLTIQPGLRYQHVRRGFDAPVVPNSLPGTNGDIHRSVTSVLPSVEANYALTRDAHVYLQWAEGALVPNQSFFYSSNPTGGNQAQPQTSQAFQGGFIYAGPNMSATLDGYWIDLKNYISTVTVAGNTEYVNNGRVRYEGIEAEVNATLLWGFSAVANGSVMSAEFLEDGMTSPAQKAGNSLSFVPHYLANIGLLYQHGPWSGSIIVRYVGPEYQGKNGSADGNNFKVGPYSYTNLAVWRSLDDLVGPRHSSIGLQINNLDNSRAVTDTAGPSIAGPLLVNVLPERSYMVTLRCDVW